MTVRATFVLPSLPHRNGELEGMSYLLGIDIGTLGTKTVLIDLNGRILSSAFNEYDVITLKPAWAEQ